MMSCSVAVYCYRCDTEAALKLHMQSHCNSRTGRAMIVEIIATRTRSSSKPMRCVDASTETDFSDMDNAAGVVSVGTQTASEELVSHTPNAPYADFVGFLSGKSTSTSRSTERQRIGERFKVFVGRHVRSDATSGSRLKDLHQDAKSFAGSTHPSLRLLLSPPNLRGAPARICDSQKYLFSINALPVPSSAPPTVGATPSLLKHRMRDLKVASFRLPDNHKNSSSPVQMSSLMIVSPGPQLICGGTPNDSSLMSAIGGGILNVVMKSATQQQLSGNSNAAARPSCSEGPFVRVLPVGEPSSDRNSAAVRAISQMQLQQQEQVKTVFIKPKEKQMINVHEDCVCSKDFERTYDLEEIFRDAANTAE